MCYMPTGSPEIRSYLRMYQSENVEHPTLAGPTGWTNEVKVRDYRKILYFIVWRMIKWSQWRSSPNHKTVSLTFGQNWYNHGNRDTLEKGKKELRQDCQSSGNIKNCWFFQMTFWKKNENSSSNILFLTFWHFKSNLKPNVLQKHSDAYIKMISVPLISCVSVIVNDRRGPPDWHALAQSVKSFQTLKKFQVWVPLQPCLEPCADESSVWRKHQRHSISPGGRCFSPLFLSNSPEGWRRGEKKEKSLLSTFLERLLLLRMGAKWTAGDVTVNKTPDSLEHNKRKDEPVVHVFSPVWFSLLKNYRSVY